MPNEPLPESAHTEESKSNASRWAVPVSLLIAVIALVLAALAYFHPAHEGATGPGQQGGNAKDNVCAGYAEAHQAVVLNTHLQSANPDVQLAIAANARLALIGGGSYLRERLAQNSAAPADLISAAASFADTVQQLGMNYLVNAAPEVQNDIRKKLDSQIAQVNKLCA